MVKSSSRCVFWKSCMQLQLIIASPIKDPGRVKVRVGWLFGGCLCKEV